MGALRAVSDCQGMDVNGILLGSPSLAGDGEPVMFLWDHPALPNGVIDLDGAIAVDVEEQ